MASPLSPLSPSRLNARPLQSHYFASPSSRTIMEDIENLEDLCYLENATPKQTSKSPVFEIHEDDHNQSDSQSLPSSPFQNTVNIDYTTQLPPKHTHSESLITIEDPDLDNGSRDTDQSDVAPFRKTSEASDRATGEPPAGQIEVQIDCIEEDTPLAESSFSEHHLGTVAEEDHRENSGVPCHQREGDDSMCNSNPGDDSVGDYTSLSAFSAIPNTDMTLFSKLRQESPIKCLPYLREQISQATPRSTKRASNDQESDLGKKQSSHPVRKYMRVDDSTNLLDLSDHMSVPTSGYRADGSFQSPHQSRRESSSRYNEIFRSPNKLSLLDYDLPIPPTPRSIPSITPRELESLKSSFLSQISSLKATLNGRDAEVASLKESVSDAERRVGEALEQVRNESARKDALEAEQLEWQRRDQEMEEILRTFKADMAESENEREKLVHRAEEAERLREQLEERMVELESQLSAARRDGVQPLDSTQRSNANTNASTDTAREVQDAVEKVARELHTLYKGKHETKVAALKKSYEARWERRVKEGESKLKDALGKIHYLQSKLNEAKSRLVDEEPAPGDATMLRENEGLEADKRVLEARIKGLEQEMIYLKRDSEVLRSELKAERAEKGELVAVVDEWLQMQQHETRPESTAPEKRSISPREEFQPEGRTEKIPMSQPVPTTGNNGFLPKSSTTTRPRQLPQSHTPRIPRFGAPVGPKSNSSGIATGRTPGRSGIMSSIERMGRGGN